MNVIIVEDNVIAAAHLTGLLSAEGHHVVATYQSGENFIDSYEKNEADVVFMDIYLNGKMTGVEAAREFRSQSETPIIFLSAMSDPESVNSRRDIEGTFYINKPFIEKEIKELVCELESKK